MNPFYGFLLHEGLRESAGANPSRQFIAESQKKNCFFKEFMCNIWDGPLESNWIKKVKMMH